MGKPKTTAVRLTAEEARLVADVLYAHATEIDQDRDVPWSFESAEVRRVRDLFREACGMGPVALDRDRVIVAMPVDSPCARCQGAPRVGGTGPAAILCAACGAEFDGLVDRWADDGGTP